MAFTAFSVFAAVSMVMATAFNKPRVLIAAEDPHDTIDISGNNTSSSYITYEKNIILREG